MKGDVMISAKSLQIMHDSIASLKVENNIFKTDVSKLSIELIDLYKSYNLVFQSLQIEKTNNDNWVSSNESLLVENELLKSKNEKMIKLLEFINDHDGVGRIVKVDIANLLDEIS